GGGARLGARPGHPPPLCVSSVHTQSGLSPPPHSTLCPEASAFPPLLLNPRGKLWGGGGNQEGWEGPVT
ncbi:unnamed protein product, partial [Gulo gulo]